MNLNQLRIFHITAGLNSFTKASRELCLTQPGISKHIKQLEEHFGIRLFDRLGKKVVPTQAGEVLYQATREIFELLDDATAKLNDLKGMTGGTLKLGASFTAGVYLIPELVGKFQARYPEIETLLEIDLSDKIARKVIANELDIGFIGAPVSDDRLVSEVLFRDELVTIIPTNHPWKKRKSVTFPELESEKVVLASKGSGTRSVVEECLATAGVSLKRTVEFGNTESVKKAVIAGMGISVISKAAVRGEVAGGLLKLLHLSDSTPTRDFYYAFHKDKYKTQTTRALLDLITEMWGEAG